MNPKRVTDQVITGEKGVALIHRRVLEMGYLWYPSPPVEAGIDGHIEIRDPTSGNALNLILQVQSKATTKAFERETATNFSFGCDERDIDYWLSGNAPVILVRSRPDTDEAYWVDVKQAFMHPETRAKRTLTFDKTTMRFDKGAAHAIFQLARPRASGLYFSPRPIREILYSNLLPVSHFGPSLFSAPTSIAEPSSVYARLPVGPGATPREWVLSSGRIHSLHDLSQPTWAGIVDARRIESRPAMPSGGEMSSEARAITLRLMHECLRSRLLLDGIEYSRACEHFFFSTGKEPARRVGHYQSISKGTRRDLVKPMISRRTQRVDCYRHHALEAKFLQTTENWYLQIVPTYRFTVDGYRLSDYHSDRLAGLKRLEHNQSVLGQVAMWASMLRGTHEGLFADVDYPLLRFGPLSHTEIQVGIQDSEWLSQEEEGNPLAGGTTSPLPLLPGILDSELDADS